MLLRAFSPFVHVFAVGVLAAGASTAFAQSLKPSDDGFMWEGHHGRVLCRANGSFELVGTDGSTASFTFFQWHDKWIYERLDAGKVEGKGLIREADGSVRLAGLWGTTGEAPALRYEMVLRPNASGVSVALSARKTAPLTLMAGIWGVYSATRKAADERVVYASPWTHRPIGTAVSGPFAELLVGVPGGPALRLAGGEIATARSRVTDNQHGLECCFHRSDFGVEETAVIEIELGFGTVPSEFPGEIRPRQAKLALGRTAPLPETVPLYGGIEFSVSLDGTWDNPFDPDDVRLDAMVRTGSGKSYVQPGFFMVPHERVVQGKAEIMVPRGEGEWRIRLAATEVGELSCELRATDRSGTVSQPLPSVMVVQGKGRGFIRVSDIDPHYLRYENGDSFVPIGHNVPIYPSSGQLVDELIPKMAMAGENHNRWWMSERGLGLEWEAELGWYRQAQSAQMDHALELARNHGMVYMLCMDTHQDFRKQGWEANPFNATNGGPCKTVEEWFTTESVREVYRKRLRYTVARWAWHQNVFCWEFGNEFEGWADCRQSVIIDWHREMAPYLAEIDPYDHLITTSWWSKTGPESCWGIPEIDVVQTHCYTNNNGNVAEQVRDFCLHQWKAFRKPHVFGEFGIRSHESTADKDPKGWGLHNAFWAAVASGCNGVPMPWWHGNYIEPLDLYFHFTAIQRFVADLPFGRSPWRQIEVADIAFQKTPAKLPASDAVFTPRRGFEKRSVTTFRVQPDGGVSDGQALSNLLHGDGHKELRNPPVLVAAFPSAGVFGVRVGRVSNSGHLRIFLDDALALEREFACGEGHGKSWQHRPQWKLWESVYDEEITIDVPAGVHRIRLENHGRDWIEMRELRFSGCRLQTRPDLLCAALACDEVAILWVQNQKSSWFEHGRGEVKPARAARIALRGLPDGEYTVEWWETWEGNVARSETARAQDGLLQLRLAALPTDTAAKIRPKR